MPIIKPSVKIQIIILAVCLWSPTSTHSACEHQKKIVWVSHGPDCYIKGDTAFFPKTEVQGQDLFPAFRPNGYLMGHYWVSESKPPQNFETYIISYYGKPSKGQDDFLALVQKFRKEGFDVSIEERTFREDVPPYESKMAVFKKAGVSGSFTVDSINDSHCRKWSIVQFLVSILNNS